MVVAASIIVLLTYSIQLRLTVIINMAAKRIPFPSARKTPIGAMLFPKGLLVEHQKRKDKADEGI
jgi:hypothetical protein